MVHVPVVGALAMIGMHAWSNSLALSYLMFHKYFID
jgi:hypothetical protein